MSKNKNKKLNAAATVKEIDTVKEMAVVVETPVIAETPAEIETPVIAETPAETPVDVPAIETEMSGKENDELETALKEALKHQSMKEIIARLTNPNDARVLQPLYTELNVDGLTEKVVTEALDEAFALAAAGENSLIKSCWIVWKGEIVSVKDVYRIACNKIGFDMTNADFTTHDAIAELKFFVEIRTGNPEKPSRGKIHPKAKE